MSPLQFDADTILMCPYCSGLYLHHRRIKAFDRLEDDEFVVLTIVRKGLSATHRIPSEGSGNPSHRRDGITIEFWCENCNKHPILTIAQEKGCTSIEWASERDRG